MKKADQPPRAVGHQLQVVVVEAKNLGAGLCYGVSDYNKDPGARGPEDPWDIHRLYLSVRCCSSIRRTSVAYVGVCVELLDRPGGLKLGKYKHTEKSAEGAPLPHKYAVQVLSVNADRLGAVLAPDARHKAACVLPHMAVSHVNTVDLADRPFDEASAALEGAMAAGFPLFLRFVSQTPNVRGAVEPAPGVPEDGGVE